MKVLLIISLFLLALNSTAGHRLEGFFKSHVLFEKQNEENKYFLNNVGRFSFIGNKKNHLMELAYGISSFSKGVSTFSSTSFDYRVSDINFVVSTEGSTFTQNLDRMLYTYSTDQYDLKIGRQPISFGSGKVINPLDVLVPFNIYTLDTENRFGVDALRFKKQIGWTGELDIAMIFGKDFESELSAAYVTYRVTVKDWDTAWTLMKFKKHHLFGVDLQGSIGDFGFWFEGAQLELKEKSSLIRWSTGLDHKWNNDLFSFIEWSYNSQGVDLESEYTHFYKEMDYFEAGIFFVGKNYLSLGLNYTINPLWSLSGSVMSQLKDLSSFVNSKAEWNIKEDYYWDFGVLTAVGPPNSEFQSKASSIYTSMRVYL